MKEVELNNFTKELAKFSSGKFLLYENKLASFLTSLSENETLYQLIEKSLKGFNFEEEFKKATVQGGFVLPGKLEKIVALVFCVLVEVDGKKLDFYKFINEFFIGEDINEKYKNFIDQVIIPFKNAVINLCTESVEPQPHILSWGEKIKPKFDEFEAIFKNFEQYLAVEPIFDGMREAIKMENQKLFGALCYSLIFGLKNRKLKKLAKSFYAQNC